MWSGGSKVSWARPRELLAADPARVHVPALVVYGQVPSLGHTHTQSTHDEHVHRAHMMSTHDVYR